jgi:DNA-binding NarL/FixJ family response regulator
MSTVRILLADDHPIVRRGLRDLLESEPDLRVVAEASDGAEAVRLAGEAEIELAILDITMPRMTGLQAAAALAARPDPPKLLMLSMHENEQFAFEALRAGASAFVLKTSADRELVAACRAVLRGETFLHAGAVGALVRAQVAGERHSDQLTPREVEVLKLVAEGHTSQEIADTLCISIKTVHRHRASLLEKTKLRDRVDLTRPVRTDRARARCEERGC